LANGAETDYLRNFTQVQHT